MSEKFDRAFDAIAQHTEEKKAAELEFETSLERVSKYVMAISNDEFMLEMIEKHPDAEPPTRPEEIVEDITRSRAGVDEAIAAAIAARKRSLLAEGHTESAWAKLPYLELNSDDIPDSSGPTPTSETPEN